jgi:hypothetical protein
MAKPMRVAGHSAMPPYPTMRLSEVMAANDIVQTTESALIVVPRRDRGGPVQLADSSDVDLRELGSTGVNAFTGWLHREYNPLMQGQQGLRIFNEMRRSDGTIRGSLRLMKMPILAARWFIEPASDSALDKKVANFIWWNLTKGMTTSFPQFVTEALLMLDFGFYMFEKVFRIDDPRPQARGKVTWKKLAPRHPLDLNEWLWDANGGPAGVSVVGMDGKDVDIPISKMLVFTFEKEAGDMCGMSVLRSAYKPWFYKQQLEKIDAIQKERHGIGVPVIKLPPNFNADDLRLAQSMGRNIRTNEMAHIVLPPNWEIMFAKLEGQPVNALESIDHHNGEIHKNVLASFMDRQGTMKDDDFSLFLKSTRYVADIITDIVNKHLIPELVDLNWSRLPNGYPELRARRIGEYADWRTQSFAIRNLVGSNIIRPDDALEDQLREEMDLPAVDEATVRITETPQDPNSEPDDDQDPNAPDKPDPKASTPASPQVKPPGPPRVGPPRQTPTPSVTTPRGNSGGDRSGG